MQESYIIYNAILIVILCFAVLDTRTTSDFLRAKYRQMCFLIILTVGVIRYDVGPDYVRYVERYYTVLRYGSVTISDYLLFDFLTVLFKNVSFGYVLVLGVYQFLTLLFVYKTLNERKIFYFGLFFFIVLDFWFQSFDGVRQTLACVIILYSTKYIEQKNLKRYLCCIFTAFFAHYSAIFLIPIYWIAHIRLSKFLLSTLLIVFLIGHYLQIWRLFFSFIYSSIPHYAERYVLTDYADFTGQFNSGLGFLCIGFFVFFVLWLCKNPIFVNLVAWGGILYFFAGGNLNIARMARYFLQVEIMALPFIFKGIKGIVPLKYLVVILSLVYYQSLIGKNNFSYKTIFSKEFLLLQFEERAN